MTRYKKSFLQLFTLVFLLPKLAIAEISHLDLKGIDDLINPQYALGASPVFGYTALKTTLENRRFLGNYGDSSRGSFCSDRASKIGDQLRANHDCPLDANSEWLQRLFPSQDGVNFVANQVGTDPISHLTPEVIGQVLQRIAQVPDAAWVIESEMEGLRKDVSALLFRSINPKKYYQTQLVKLRDDLKNENRKGKDCVPKVKGQLEVQIAEIQTILARASSPAPHGESPPTVEADVDAADAGRAASPESTTSARSDEPLKDGVGKQGDFDRIAKLLVDALQESRRAPRSASGDGAGSSVAGGATTGAASTVSSPNGYPKYLPEQALLAFFIKKNNDKNDLVSLFRGMPSLLKDSTFLSSPARQAAFIGEKWKKSDHKPEAIQAASAEAARELAQHPEKLVFSMMEDRLSSKPLPPILSYGSAAHESLARSKPPTYPDCGETSLRNFFNILVYDSKTGKFNPEILTQLEAKHPGLHLFPKLKEFYTNPPDRDAKDPDRTDPSAASSQKMRDLWSQTVVSGHERRGVHYLMPSGAPVCELNAGVDNIMSLVDQLIPGLSGGTPDRASKIDRLCEFLKRTGFELSWKAYELDLMGNRVREIGKLEVNASYDTKIGLEFSLNGIVSFEWQFQSSHFAVKDLTESASSWKNQLAGELVRSTGPYVSSALSWFSNERTFDLLAAHEPREILIYALPLSNNDGRLVAFRRIVSSPIRDEAVGMEPLAKRLRAKLPEATDFHTRQQIHRVLAEADYPFGPPVHALGKREAVYTRVSHHEMVAKFGESIGNKMRRSWKRKMFGHDVVIGESLLDKSGSEIRLSFESAIQACLDLNPEPKKAGVIEAYKKREADLDAVRKISSLADPAKDEELKKIHEAQPIQGCYLMSLEEWQIPLNDFGFLEDQYIQQILPGLGRMYWTGSGSPDNPTGAYVFQGVFGEVTVSTRGYTGGYVRCACSGG